MASNLTITYREVRDWPGKPRTWHEKPPFKPTTTRMWTGLEREMKMLGVYACEIFGYFRARDFRRDGGLYADARPEKPGIMLEYKRNGQRYRFQCDKFNNWLDNLDAIVRSLEGLRVAERYGVMAGQQYEGFKALPEKSSASTTTSTQSAAELLARLSGMRSNDVMANPVVARDAFRRARLAAHPDRQGGKHDDFIAVTSAGTALSGFFGETIDA